MSDINKWKEKGWDKANNLFEKFQEVEYAQIARESQTQPGIMVGLPVRVIQVDVPKESFRDRSLPYVGVIVELPNGETRKLNLEALKKCGKKKFKLMQSVFNLID